MARADLFAATQARACLAMASLCCSTNSHSFCSASAAEDVEEESDAGTDDPEGEELVVVVVSVLGAVGVDVCAAVDVVGGVPAAIEGGRGGGGGGR